LTNEFTLDISAAPACATDHHQLLENNREDGVLVEQRSKSMNTAADDPTVDISVAASNALPV